MGGLKIDAGTGTVVAGHAFVQNIRRAIINSPPMFRRSFVS
jgi:hypothetical protein